MLVLSLFFTITGLSTSIVNYLLFKDFIKEHL